MQLRKWEAARKEQFLKCTAFQANQFAYPALFLGERFALGEADRSIIVRQSDCCQPRLQFFHYIFGMRNRSGPISH